MDPSAPPPIGTSLTFVKYTLTDANNDNDLDRFNNDLVNGSDIRSSYPGDTITINVPGVGNITYTGVTFYLANGQVVFTPNDGQALQNGTFVTSTFVNGQGPLLTSQLGPPCFTAGTMIRVPDGAVPVETLAPEDWVETLDQGPQPLRWIGKRTVDGTGDFAPIRIAKGALGNSRTLRVSPQHRMLISGWLAELHFGQVEVLVAAKHLVGVKGITTQPTASITYVHLLFDRHEIVFAEGAPSESLHPGSEFLDCDHELRREITAIFPNLPASGNRRAIRSARPVVRGNLARVLPARHRHARG
jgi:hypothetical protein